jgi:predicted transcriptional regulator
MQRKKRPGTTTPVSVSLDSEYLKRLDALAWSERRTRTDYIRTLIDRASELAKMESTTSKTWRR